MSLNSKLRKLAFKEIELRQLRSFCLAATRQNFATAALELGLSRPAVWQQVRALERALGTTLLQRRGRSVELTAEGRVLLDLVQPHVSGLDSLARLFESSRHEIQQYLTVASTLYLLSHHLLEPIREFTAAHPSVRVRLREELEHQEAARMVERAQADLAVVPCESKLPRSPRLDYEPLFELQYTLLTSTHHPLARKKSVRPEDLVKYPLILAGSGPSHLTLERWLQRHDLLDRLHGIVEIRSTDITQKYVAAGVGIALLYMGGEADRPLPGLHRVVLDTGQEELYVALISRKGAHLPEAAGDFCRIVRGQLARMGSPAKK
jgi:DNA-binding transcriptional LysR family regulator